MALRRHVNPVGAPQPPVAQGAHAPQVDDRGVVATGDRPDVRGVGRRPSPARPDQRRVTWVGGGSHQDVGATGTQPGHRILEPGGQGVDVSPGPKDVVAAAHDADQVRPQGKGVVDLPAGDVDQEPAAYRQVGIAKVVAVLAGHPRKVRGQAVGPSDIHVGAVGIGVAHPLCEGVPDGHVAREGLWLAVS